MTELPLLQVIDGEIGRGLEVLIDQVNISLQPGEITLLTGPNGSGKSTLLTALAGEKFLSSGILRFGGTRRSQISLKDMAKRRSLMLQQDEAVDQLRAKDVLELANIGLASPQYSKDFVSEIFSIELREKTIGSLSIGQRTRVFLAAAAIQNSEIMLLDEPTAGLDVQAISLLSDFLTAHTSNGGAAILATHEDSLRSIASKELSISGKRLTTKKLG